MTEQIQALWRGQKGYEGRGKASPSSGTQIMSTQVNSMVIIYGMLYNLLSLLAPLTTLTVSLNYGKMREMIIWQNKVDKLRCMEYNTCNTLHGSASFNTIPDKSPGTLCTFCSLQQTFIPLSPWNNVGFLEKYLR